MTTLPNIRSFSHLSASSDPRCAWLPNEASCNGTGAPLDLGTGALLYFNSSSGHCTLLSCVDNDTSVDLLFPDVESCMGACVRQPPVLGGCEGTRYGCCPDGKTPRGKDDSCDEMSEGQTPNRGECVGGWVRVHVRRLVMARC